MNSLHDLSTPRIEMTDDLVNTFIAGCRGDAHAAVRALLIVVDGLQAENEALRRAPSPGFARRPKTIGAPAYGVQRSSNRPFELPDNEA
jgi:hypothetical protein